MQKKLSQEFREFARETTGISLDEEDVEVRKRGDGWVLSVTGHELLRIAGEEMPERPEDEGAIDVLLADLSNLHEELVEARIRLLEEHLDPVLESIRDKVRNELREVEPEEKEELVENLWFEIEDMGFPRHHATPDEEAEWGYPDIYLRVRHFDLEGMDLSYRLNPHLLDDCLENRSEVEEEILASLR